MFEKVKNFVLDNKYYFIAGVVVLAVLAVLL